MDGRAAMGATMLALAACRGEGDGRTPPSQPAAAAMPAAEPTFDLPDRITARYRCDNGFRFAVLFDNRADTATLALPAQGSVVLADQRPASGIWYAAAGHELRGKGRDATLTRPGRPPLACRALR